jgi:hypothetical protein
MLVHIELANFDPPGHSLDQLLHDRLHHLARRAPRTPEVHKDRHGTIQHFGLKIIIR